MHGFTNYKQSKALYERGYRHPEPIYGVDNIAYYKGSEWYNIDFPAFSLADIVTMQGERFYMPPQVSVADVIEYNMKYMLKQSDAEVQVCNERLRGEYE